MRHTINSFLKSFALLALLATAFVSCKEDDKGDVVPNRLFKPPFIADSTYAKNNSLHVGWYPVKGAVSYKVEVGKNDFADIVRTEETEGNLVVFADLPWDTEFGVRLMAISAIEGENSRYALVEGGMKTEAKPYVNIFKPLVALSENSVTVAWGSYTTPVSAVLLYKGETLDKTQTTGIEGGSFVFTGLDPDTEYTAVLGTADENMPEIGTVTFTTYPTGIITLAEGDDLYTKVNASPDGSTFLLPPGRTYVYDSGAGDSPIERSFTLIGGVGSEDGSKVRFYVQGGFAPQANGNVDHMRFINLEVNGWGDTEGIYQTGMFIAEGGADSYLGLVEFKDCTVIHAQWAFIYLKGANQVIDHVRIDNCQLSDLGAQWGQEAPICGVQATGSGYNNITMINSTLTNCPAGVVTSNKSATGNIHIENCTFYNAIRAPFMLINYKTNNVAGTITIKNNLFGMNYAPMNQTAQTQGAIVNGTALPNSPLIAGNYAATDYTAELNPIPAMNSVGAASATIFRDSENGDLTVLHPTLKRYQIGDPRWYR